MRIEAGDGSDPVLAAHFEGGRVVESCPTGNFSEQLERRGRRRSPPTRARSRWTQERRRGHEELGHTARPFQGPRPGRAPGTTKLSILEPIPDRSGGAPLARRGHHLIRDLEVACRPVTRDGEDQRSNSACLTQHMPDWYRLAPRGLGRRRAVADIRLLELARPRHSGGRARRSRQWN
jgi:hypothetical protein